MPKQQCCVLAEPLLKSSHRLGCFDILIFRRYRILPAWPSAKDLRGYIGAACGAREIFKPGGVVDFIKSRRLIGPTPSETGFLAADLSQDIGASQSRKEAGLQKTPSIFACVGVQPYYDASFSASKTSMSKPSTKIAARFLFLPIQANRSRNLKWRYLKIRRTSCRTNRKSTRRPPGTE